MNKDSINNAVEIMVKVLVVVGAVIGVIIFIILLFTIKYLKNNLRNKPDNVQIHEGYSDKAKSHLEGKYGKKFIINPKGANDGVLKKKQNGRFICFLMSLEKKLII
ncbi:hypothetical protein [Clostridium sp. Marseille-P2415]|uniref:hypothetical protein n=1 Tax=Clostridium sp. Marseille-P2415 TaxID=1805471 RepID=UPI0009885330|nr:hypothetical protein [Clostridium sp. Marseille-P2415]